MESTVQTTVSFALTLFGFVAILGVIIAPLTAAILGIIYLIEDNEKSKKKLGRWTMYSGGCFVLSLVLIAVIFFAFAGVNSFILQ